MPQAGVGVWLVVAIAAVGFGLGAASIVAAVFGEHVSESSRWGTPAGQHRIVALLVGLGYIAIAVLILQAAFSSRS